MYTTMSNLLLMDIIVKTKSVFIGNLAKFTIRTARKYQVLFQTLNYLNIVFGDGRQDSSEICCLRLKKWLI